MSYTDRALWTYVTPRLRLAWAILRGRSVIYRARFEAPVCLSGDVYEIAECMFYAEAGSACLEIR